ncbi:troponin T, skeletal muscle-like [Chenopodium quinoa]|uniref:troponin T, skeletal muscle-like n=1 Tax=Chenopodium quinoa TaxID=63459 RepID=UPI000B790A39|nr:troponin T, skeletal muscle-like [Chenopodium quinoa]
MLRVSGLRKPINEKNKEVKKDLEAVRKKILELEKFLKDLKAELAPLKEADKEAKGLHNRVNKLKGRLQNQEAQLTQKLNEKAGEEKMAIVQDMMDDCSAIMKMTWPALFLESGYEKWETQFAICTDQYNKKIMDQADGEEDAEGEAFDSTFGESDQEEDDKEEKEEADAEEEQPQEEVDAEKEQPPVEEPKEAAADTERPPQTA